MRKTARLIAPLVAVAALWAVPSFASAADYCVSDQACVDAGGTSEPDVQTALDAAASTPLTGDRVKIGAGTFSTTGAYSYNTVNSLNTVQIVGAGRDQTYLRSTSTTPATKTLSLTGLSKSSVSDLTVVSPDPIPGGGNFRALELTGGASHIGIEGQKGSALILARLSGAQALLNDAVIHQMNGGGDTAVEVGSGTAAAIVDSTFNDPDGTGVYVDGGASVRITHMAFTGRRGLIDAGGNLRVESSRFSVTTDGLDAAYGSTLALDHVTAVGSGVWHGVLVAPEFSGYATKVTVRNSVLTGFEHAVTRAGVAGATADVTVAYSDFDPSTIFSTGPGTLDTVTGNIDASPGFADAAGGDFHLAPGSALIDAGDPAGLSPGESDTDLDGNPRLVGRTDIGAYEKQPDPPAQPSQGPDPSSGGGGTQTQPPAPVAPRIVVSGASKQRIGKHRAIVLKVTSDQAVTLKARTTLKLRGVHSAIALKPLTTTHGAGTFKVKLVLTRKQAAKIVRARSAKAQVQLTASNAAGLNAAAKRAVKLVH